MDSFPSAAEFMEDGNERGPGGRTLRNGRCGGVEGVPLIGRGRMSGGYN